MSVQITAAGEQSQCLDSLNHPVLFMDFETDLKIHFISLCEH